MEIPNSVGYGSNYVTVNGVPFKKGDIVADPNYYGPDRVKLYHKETGIHSPLINVNPTKIINEVTAEPFATFADFDAFYKEHFFFDGIGSGGGAGSGSPYFMVVTFTGEETEYIPPEGVSIAYVALGYHSVDGLAFVHQVPETGAIDLTALFPPEGPGAGDKLFIHGFYV